MKKIIIKGNKKLHGEVNVSGSKNAALPIICASLLTEKEVVLENIPDIEDVRSLISIINALNVKTEFRNNILKINAATLKKKAIPERQVNKMRASILILGSLIHRFKEVKMAFPGGCVLGKRAVDTHTYAFKKLGAEIIEEKKYLHLKARKLIGTKIILPELSVTATENAIMAATLSDGITEIRLAAAEPHVQDLCFFLKKLGAKINGIGTNNLQITGVNKLGGGKYRISGDYLEAGTLAIATAGTNGNVKIKGIPVNQLDSLWQKFEEIGVNFELGNNFVHIFPSREIKAIKMLKTAVFPGFPTDLQAPFVVLLTKAKGVSKIFETLFEGRLNYLFEMEKMGAHIEFLNPHQALIIGPARLKGVPISSCDIRAGAAMIIAALIADGETEISNINYIDRGYEKIDEKLRGLGADIKRTD